MMKKLIIKEIDYEFGNELDSFLSFKYEGKEFCIFIELEIGYENEEGSERFGSNVCNIEGLKQLYQIEKSNIKSDYGAQFLNSYNLLLMEEFDPQLILRKVEKVLQEAAEKSDNWSQAAMYLNQYFSWEYEEEFIFNVKKFK